MRDLIARIVMTVAAMALSAPVVAAQAPPVRRIEVGARPTCPQCTVTLVPVRAFRDGIDTLGPTSVNVHLTAAIDGKRNIIAVAEGERRLLVYDSTGRLVRTVGRQGRGPGEFNLIMAVRVGPGDSVWVFDNGNLRVSVFDPQLTRLARSFPSRGVEPVLLRDGRVLVFGNHARSGTLPGPPLHVLTPPSLEMRSFGVVPTVPPRIGSFPRARLVPARARGDAWLAWERRYRIELWDAEGRQHMVIERSIDWFPPWDDRNDAPGRPWITSVHEDARGRLWVLLQRTLQEGDDPAFPPGRGRPVPTEFEIRLEILDPATGTLVMSTRLSGGYAHLAGDLVTRYPQTPDGISYIELLRLVLTERQRLVGPTRRRIDGCAPSVRRPL